MKARLLATHLLSLIAGGSVAVAFTRKAVVETQARLEVREPLSGKGGRPVSEARSSPRELLERMAEVTMESGDRQHLKSKLIKQWAESDPAGLLKYLEHRAWPDRYGEAGSAFAVLALRDPKGLLHYARAQGCQDALKSLARYGNPDTVLRLFLAEQEKPVPGWAYQEVFQAGAELDPGFHQRVVGIQDSRAREEAFGAAAKGLLEAKQFDECLHWIKSLEDNIPPDRIGAIFGELLASDEASAGWIGSLPATARTAAVAGMVREMTDQSADTDDHLMDSLADLYEAGWWGWAGEDPDWAGKVESAIQSRRTADLSEAEKWRDWALSLPPWDESQILRELGIRRWVSAAPGEWEQFEALPDERLRDVAHAQAALEVAEEQRSAALARIHDPELREATFRELEERKAHEGDPFE